jgi:two-component system sensor histidine kinase/response regulator
MKKILIIDDDISLLSNIEIYLEGNNYQPFITSNGYQGIQIAKEKQVDLIICDINMPVIDGLEVLERLRQDPETLGIPFLFLTGEGRDLFRKGMELGADDYLNKPFEPTELLKVIEFRFKKHEIFKEKSEVKIKELRENLTRMLPHELKTSLTGILGYSEFLLDSYDETMPKAEVLEIIRHIHKGALRLQSLTENFLLYSNLKLLQTNDSALKPLKNETFNITKVKISDIALQIARNYARTEDLQFSAEESVIKIPDYYFHKVFTELVDNALKFSNPGTKVKITGEVKDGFYYLNIMDSGRGILPEQISRIEAFMQFDRNLYEQQGAGLGLIIAKLISEIFELDFIIKNNDESKGTNIQLKFNLV